MLETYPFLAIWKQAISLLEEKYNVRRLVTCQLKYLQTQNKTRICAHGKNCCSMWQQPSVTDGVKKLFPMVNKQ